MFDPIFNHIFIPFQSIETNSESDTEIIQILNEYSENIINTSSLIPKFENANSINPFTHGNINVNYQYNYSFNKTHLKFEDSFSKSPIINYVNDINDELINPSNSKINSSKEKPKEEELKEEKNK